MLDAFRRTLLKMRDWLVSFFSLRNPTIVVLSCGACVSILVVVSTAAEFQVMDRLTVGGPTVVLGSTTVSGALGVGGSGLEGGTLVIRSTSTTGANPVLDVRDNADNSAVAVLENGKVGVGTTVPATKLDVAGDAQFGSGVLKSTFSATPDSTTYALSLSSGVALADGCVKFADNSVQCAAAAELADGAVTTSKLASDAVTSAKLADGAVTTAKLAADECADGQILKKSAGQWVCASEGGGAPAGQLNFFNLASCPSGWSELTPARGRYLVGLPSGGTLAGITGTALSNGENRSVGQHNHSISDPGHSHSGRTGDSTPRTIASGGNHTSGLPTGSSNTGITINNSGTTAGTNAPYIQFLVCQKN